MTVTLAGVVSGLVSFGSTVSGSQGSYDAETFGDAKNAGSIAFPCFVAVATFENQPEFFTTLAMMGNAPQTYDTFDHYALYAEVASNPDFMYYQQTAIALVDAYRVALEALPFLTAATAPSIQNPPKVSRRYAQVTLLGVAYHAIIFRHQARLYS